MRDLIQPILDFLKPETIAGLGYVAMTLIVFTETGLLIGFCLPGDSLLVTAGFFAAGGRLNFWTINALLIPAAIIGDSLGYWIGLKVGPRLFNRKKSFFFNPAHLRSAQDFYEKHGGKTIVLARFVPVVRTFAPLVAGIGRMNYRHFLAFNVFGGIGWVGSMTLIGYLFARFVGADDANNAKKLEYLIVAVIVISIIPAAIPVIKGWITARRAGQVDKVPANEPEDPRLAATIVDPIDPAPRA